MANIITRLVSGITDKIVLLISGTAAGPVVGLIIRRIMAAVTGLLTGYAFLPQDVLLRWLEDTTTLLIAGSGALVSFLLSWLNKKRVTTIKKRDL